MTDQETGKFFALIQQLFAICAELEAMFPGRPFTPDGHTMGSIGEVLAAAQFGLELEKPSRTGMDARTRIGSPIEVKATGGKRGGSTPIAFSSDPGEVHVLVVRVAEDGSFFPEYNGPGALLMPHLSPRRKNGQRTISLARLRKLQKDVGNADRLTPQRDLLR